MSSSDCLAAGCSVEQTSRASSTFSSSRQREIGPTSDLQGLNGCGNVHLIQFFEPLRIPCFQPPKDLSHIFPVAQRVELGLLSKQRLHAKLVADWPIITLDELDRQLEEHIHKSVKSLLALKIIDQNERTYRRMEES